MALYTFLTGLKMAVNVLQFQRFIAEVWHIPRDAGIAQRVTNFHPRLVKVWLFLLVLKAYLVSAITERALCQIGKIYVRDFEGMMVMQFLQDCGYEFYFGMTDT